MSAIPTGDSGDAVQRLRDEHNHILELFDTYAGHQRDPDPRVADVGRLATLIYTLLRVHCEMEAMLLESSLKDQLNFRAAAAELTSQRSAMLDALERAEALSHHDPAHGQEMEALAQRVRAWFQADEQLLFTLARHSGLDLATLDKEMATRQEALLSAEASVPRVYAARSLSPALNSELKR